MHKQLVEEMLPAGEFASAGQDVQEAEPEAALYLAASHAEHVPPFGPVYPALHTQLLEEVLPEGEYEFD
jgi:hypothetical protein